MKAVCRACAFLAAFLAASSLGRAQARATLSIITEAPGHGRGPAPAGGAESGYYVAHDAGETDEGVPIGGERPPPAAVLGGALQQALARNGYHPAEGAQPASLLLFYRWGSYNREAGGFPTLDRESWVERAALAGGTRFGEELLDAINSRTVDFFRNRNFESTVLMQEASSNLYYLVVSAFELGAARRGERVLLWRTKMSTIALGVTMDEAIPALARAAGPYFGRPMKQAALVPAHFPSAGALAGEPPVRGDWNVPLPAGFKPGDDDLYAIPKQRIALSPPF